TCALPISDFELDNRTADTQIGIGRTPNNEVADLLRAEADAVERVRRLDPAPLELVADVVIGDRFAPDPDDRRRQDQPDQDDQQPELGQSPGPVPPLAVVQIDMFDQPFVLEGSFDTLYRTIVISGAHPGFKTSLRGDRSVSPSIGGG